MQLIFLPTSLGIYNKTTVVIAFVYCIIKLNFTVIY